MGIQERLTQEQWKALFNAPTAAASFVASASGGGLEMIKELFSASKFIQEAAVQKSGSDYGTLVDEFVEAIKGMSPKDAMDLAVKYESKDPAAIRSEAKQVVANGVAVIAGLPEADGFTRWILDMARRVAETKTGGVLGIGGIAVIDEKEQAALDELAAMMGV